jgi:predicted RNA binding protein YcfA (HicA-like mRNA interferase family)
MLSRRIIKRLKGEGWTKERQTGDHLHFKHPTNPLICTVVHPRRDYPAGTLRRIFKVAGWEWPPEL